MNKTKVSICCITYNQEDYIREALDSFINQNVNFKYEIIIHDDASTDKTTQIIKEYQKKYPNIIIPIFEKENVYSKDPNSIMKITLSKAKGEYIALCDGDDGFLDNNKLQKQVDYMDKHKDIVLCSHNTKVISSNNSNNNYDNLTPYREGIVTIYDFFHTSGSMHTSSMLFRRKDVQNLPEYYFKATVGDLPLKLYLLSIGNCFHMNDVMSFYRINANGSWTTKQRQNPLALKNNHNMEINVYRMFNKETNYQYKDLVEKRILEKNFNYYKNINDLKEIKKEKYRSLYNKLSLSEKLKLKIKNIPFIYRVYTRLKYRK